MIRLLVSAFAALLTIYVAAVAMSAALLVLAYVWPVLALALVCWVVSVVRAVRRHQDHDAGNGLDCRICENHRRRELARMNAEDSRQAELDQYQARRAARRVG